ncbi:MAG: hypothetical protein K6A74_06250, partial [Lachnospiraceae bacterium]|nr:hypothetical protein [Lachnospiraceae bacterium]
MRRSEILLFTLLFFAFILHQVTVPVMATANEEGITEGLSSALFVNEKTEEAVPEVITGEEQAAEATIAEELTNEEITEEETSEAVPEVVIEDKTVPDDETAGESKVPGLKKMESASVETYGVGNTELWSDGLTASLSYAFSGGNGSQDDPYILSTATDLAMLSLNVYSLDGGGYSGKWFRQTADIDLVGKNWFPIGSGVRAFEGNYDGAGHKVKNAKIITSEDQRFNNFSHIGFFGMLSRGSIKDLGVENAY